MTSVLKVSMLLRQRDGGVIMHWVLSDMADPTIIVSGIQALLGVPTALNEATALLRRKKPESDLAAGQLDLLRNNLLGFAEIGHWFAEVKQLHQFLQALDTDLGFVPQIQRASPTTLRAKMDEAMLDWARTKHASFARLMGFVQEMRYEGELTVLVFPDGTRGRAPRWFEATLQKYQSLEELRIQWERVKNTSGSFSESFLPRILDSFDALRSHVATQMMSADRRIVTTAQELGDALLQISRGIRNG